MVQVQGSFQKIQESGLNFGALLREYEEESQDEIPALVRLLKSRMNCSQCFITWLASTLHIQFCVLRSQTNHVVIIGTQVVTEREN